jgi:hypothetical protein
VTCAGGRIPNQPYRANRLSELSEGGYLKFEVAKAREQHEEANPVEAAFPPSDLHVRDEVPK